MSTEMVRATWHSDWSVHLTDGLRVSDLGIEVLSDYDKSLREYDAVFSDKISLTFQNKV